MKSNAVGRQVDCELLNVDQIAKRCPYINTDDLKGGLWVPGDGVADPREICMALTHLSRDMGVHVVPQCEVGREKTCFPIAVKIIRIFLGETSRGGQGWCR